MERDEQNKRIKEFELQKRLAIAEQQEKMCAVLDEIEVKI